MNTIGGKIMENSKKKKGRWRKSVEQDGITKEIAVREADNDGYIITLRVYGDVEQKDGTTKWVDKEKEIISKTNPLGEEDDVVKQGMDALESALEDNLEF